MDPDSDERLRIERLRFAPHPGAAWRLQTRDGEGLFRIENRGTFDELVVDHWFHIENMDERSWWMRVGDVRLVATIDREGRVTVDIQRGSYGEVSGTTEGEPPPR